MLPNKNHEFIYKDYVQCVLNLILHAKVGIGSAILKIAPSNGVQGSKKLYPAFFVFLGPLPIQINQKINFGKQILREPYFERIAPH